MKKLLLITFSLFWLCSSAQTKNAIVATSKQLNKILGSWQTKESKGKVIGETWMKKNETTYLGKSYFIKGTDTTLYETVELVRSKTRVQYIATAAGQNNELPVSFTLTAATDSSLTFENPQHDYPKRIVYIFGKTTIHAFIDDGTEMNRRHYYFKKVFIK